MIETVEEYKCLLNHLRKNRAQNKQSRHLNSKLEGLEEVEGLINNIADIIDISCDHNWEEWEDEICNAQMRCTKCKEIRL